MQSFHATTLLPVADTRVWDEIDGVLDSLWPGEVEVLQQTDELLLHGVAGDVWLTWKVEPFGSRAARVHLSLDECDELEAPEPDLDAVLLTLMSRCLETHTVRE